MCQFTSLLTEHFDSSYLSEHNQVHHGKRGSQLFQSFNFLSKQSCFGSNFMDSFRLTLPNIIVGFITSSWHTTYQIVVSNTLAKVLIQVLQEIKSSPLLTSRILSCTFLCLIQIVRWFSYILKTLKNRNKFKKNNSFVTGYTSQVI